MALGGLLSGPRRLLVTKASMNRLLFWLGFILCLGVPVALVAHQEKLRRGSVVIYLRLAPVCLVDPTLIMI